MDNHWKDPFLGMEFCFIPSGKMRVMKTNERFRKIDLSGFWIGKYPVTQRQWLALMGGNPSHFKRYEYRAQQWTEWDYIPDQIWNDPYLDCPVDSVTWYECMEFVFRLNALNDQLFRLPTVSEWLHANTYKEPINEETLNLYAWYGENSLSQTHTVGQKTPNTFGVHDMFGNVCEWCADWFQHDFFDKCAKQDPLCVDNDSKCRTLCGGSWESYRASFFDLLISFERPNYALSANGFRIVCSNPTPQSSGLSVDLDKKKMRIEFDKLPKKKRVAFESYILK
ncbi:formylglycine-generating enzyme family protein [Magnetococcus sp. PR-3]|uniref:formylglycine-generating enzyme family protein n=1 Tax=Magnetococcus sp. PR-3 TaxID=3120355 RepID=UPI002FCE083E